MGLNERYMLSSRGNFTASVLHVKSFPPIFLFRAFPFNVVDTSREHAVLAVATWK